ncbi:23144_t:CDS:2 [Racocetra persica]|uniref:23144_t:CDS:1 n=1 Tax=Racocetra persica TaxID=160502 RepID=A0ACA9QPW7_9GLOM|nr:23144_t:CDS:2 [Racocetra persica]
MSEINEPLYLSLENNQISMKNDTNSPDTFDGNIAWILTAACFTWLMTPGIGLFYSGLARRKNALSLIMLCFLTIPIVSAQWFIWGYSLAFNRNSSPYFGNLQNAFFSDLDWDSGPTNASQNIPEFLFAFFECMFAILASAIIIGGAAERIRIFPTIIFIFLWSTLVYDALASWCWSINGWMAKMGGLDYAGGVPVHVASGAAALAFCLIVGRRREDSGLVPHNRIIDVIPHNIINVVIGTIFLWFGWFGFNAGSALAANKRAIMACIVSNLSASFGGLTWMLLDYWRNGYFYAVSFCSGAISGLVAITSGAGYVSPLSAIIFGISGGLICNLAGRLKSPLKFDDSMDVFAIHCVGGFVGNVLTGVFADKTIAARSGEVILGGAINGNYDQILIQLLISFVGMIYSFIATIIILFIIGTFLRCTLRLNTDGELDGADITEHGEAAYCFADANE